MIITLKVQEIAEITPEISVLNSLNSKTLLFTLIP
jgi:hypothetical protein